MMRFSCLPYLMYNSENMSSSESKPQTDVKGDHDVTIIQNQEVHTEHHMNQDLKATVL